ncbi:50S ribosomal protein L11 methyltransferase [Coraliomargarita sp. SDUM461004]|uniref:50S ribosomal protein L11 methyltransferase n=1 Tax=Thalassobacterium sedimentorum TaxID=3041258 RepID=A0ABU1ALW7_9BACT|nr:50S ribosomal protein L11 methyltransferase [Coraliomargarita sp. SDUM461004]MDQ8194845.1 50S ribosomal protein L11 methyltransferase [Coraliomargarita sp. SDUM461004]
MSNQVELRTGIPDEMADILEDYFCETESPYWGIMQKEITDPYELFGIFPDSATAESELVKLRQDFKNLPEDFELTEIIDADWQNAYKEFVKPWNDRQLHWIPLWERDNSPPPEGSAVVYLDAGMAFGTGAHETTRLCARRLLDYLEAQPEARASHDVIDAGCGSGVLALSASALGFKKTYAFDFDAEAITVCHSNSAENTHLPKPEFAVADLERGFANGRQGDLVLANIQTDVLIPHSKPLIHGVKCPGTLALSGILTKELEQVRTHFAAEFAAQRPEASIEIDSRQDGEWGDLLFRLA